MTIGIETYRRKLNAGELCPGCGMHAHCMGLVRRGTWCTFGSGKMEDYQVPPRCRDGRYICRGERECIAFIAKTREIIIEGVR